MDFLEPNDYDVFVIVDSSLTDEEVEQLNMGNEPLEENNKPVIYHFFKELPLQKHMTFYAYLEHYREKLYGEDIPPACDIFDNKNEYITALKKAIAHFKKFPKVYKSLYHVLIGAFMLKNGSYDLTADQIEIVEKAHGKDEGSYEENLELAESLIEELGSRAGE